MNDERFAARRRGLLVRRWRRIAVAVLAAAVLGLVVWLIWFSSVLAVRTVVVEGETTLKELQVRSAAGIRIGQPLARVDTVAIEARVASMERVQAVTVSRSWLHTVRIELVERVAVAFLRLGGEIRGVDRFGIDFRSYSDQPKGLLEARVTIADARLRQQTLVSVAAVVDVIGRKDPTLRKQLQGISAGSKDSIVLDLTKGRTVNWGSAGDSTRKLTVLRPLLRIKASAYDVSAPDQPTTRK